MKSKNKKNKIKRTKNKKFKKRNLFAYLATIILLICVCFFGVKIVTNIVYPQRFQSEVEAASSKFNVEKELIYAIIKTESGFNPNAQSGADAYGLMQITPRTFKWLQGKLNESLEDYKIFEPRTNIYYGTYYISILKKRFANEKEVLSAYNAGPENVKAWLKHDKNLENIPYIETKNYVKKVQTAKQIYYEKLKN